MRASANPVPNDDPIGGWLAEFLAWWIDTETGYPIAERSGVIRWFVRLDNDMVWAGSRDELLKRYPNIRRNRSHSYPPNSKTIRCSWREIPTISRISWPFRGSSDSGCTAATGRSVPRPARCSTRTGSLADAGSRIHCGAGPLLGQGRHRGRRKVHRGRAHGAHPGEPILDRGRRVRGQWSALKREQVILETAELDGPDVHIWVEQEPGSGGKESAEATIRMLAGYIAHADRA